jgi:hypothetical protein
MCFRRHSKLITFAIILAVVTIMAFSWLAPFWTRSRLEKEFGIKLPQSSEEIRFDVRSSPSNQLRCVFARIRMLKFDYAELVNDMGLKYYSTSQTDMGEGDWKISGFGEIDWWTSSTHIPPDAASKFTSVNDESTYVIAKYEDGYMYLKKCVSNPNTDIRD